MCVCVNCFVFRGVFIIGALYTPAVLFVTQVPLGINNYSIVDCHIYLTKLLKKLYKFILNISDQIIGIFLFKNLEI